MEIQIDHNGIWYHGTNRLFDELQAGSTVTQWRELAEAFAHKPTLLCIEDDGTISHNGVEKGYLFRIDEPVMVGDDLYPHPRTTMDKNAEFLTNRPLRVRLIKEL